MNPLSIAKNEEGRPSVDELLHDFFQTKMPQPWPTFKFPVKGNGNGKTKVSGAPTPHRVGSFRSRYTGRLALAACVTLLIAGYLTLSAFFPQQQNPSGAESIAPPMGKGLKEARTPHHPQQPVVAPQPEEIAPEMPQMIPIPGSHSKKPRKT